MRTNEQKERFSRAVKVALVLNGMTQRDLTRAVVADIGIKESYCYVNACISGAKSSKPVRDSICKILNIKEV